MIYLDNAATTFPKPLSVKKSLLNAINKFGANPGRSGHDFSISASMEIYKSRKAVCDFFNAEKPEDVIFTLNCTQAINFVIKGLLKPGDHVVISCLEHNSVLRAVSKLQPLGVSFTKVDISLYDNDKTLDNFRKGINDKTKLIICTHASNVWGLVFPIERICALAHIYNIPIMVDAAQTAGIIPIDLKDNPVDYLCIAPHKGLYAPMGTGILITNKPDTLDTLIEGGTGSNSNSEIQPDFPPDKFESGTLNTLGIIALREGINFINKIGIENIFSHEIKLVRYLYKNLSATENIKLYTKIPEIPDEKYFVPVISFNVGNMPSEEVASILNKYKIYVRSGLHCAPLAHKLFDTDNTGAVRVSVSYFTKKSDIDFLIYKIREIALSIQKHTKTKKHRV